jgi:hypothetical protein
MNSAVDLTFWSYWSVKGFLFIFYFVYIYILEDTGDIMSHGECRFKIGCSTWNEFTCVLCDSGGIYRFGNNTRWHATVIPVYQDWGKNVLLFMQLQNVSLFSWNMVLIRKFPESFSNFDSFCERNLLYWVIVMDIWWQYSQWNNTDLWNCYNKAWCTSCTHHV